MRMRHVHRIGDVVSSVRVSDTAALGCSLYEVDWQVQACSDAFGYDAGRASGSGSWLTVCSGESSAETLLVAMQCYVQNETPSLWLQTGNALNPLQGIRMHTPQRW